MAEAIFYLLIASCIAWVSWVVTGTLGDVRRRRKSRLIERGLAEYLLERANQKRTMIESMARKVTYEQALVAHGWVVLDPADTGA